MAIEPLVAAISGSGLVVADLSDLDPNLRLTSEYVQVLQTGDPNLRLTSEYIQVLYKAPGTRYLTADITGSCILVPRLTDDLVTTIFVQANVTANLTGIWQFSSDIVGSGVVSAFIAEYHYLSVDITSSAILYGDLAFRKSAGNTLALTQSATPEIILGLAVSSTLDFVSSAEAEYVVVLNASSTLTFIGVSTWDKVLPTETALSNLVLSQLVEGFRAAESILNLTQSATVYKNVNEESVESELNLTDTATVDTVLNLSVESTLIFTQEAIGTWWGIWTCSSTLTLNQDAIGTLIDIDNFILLQAPWGNIQTSIILPAPEWGDTENLVSDLNLRRSMSGETYTYVKSNDNRLLKYLFLLPRMKALEFEQFLKSYNASDIKLMNWKGEVWKVNLMTNPIDFVLNSRYGPTSDRTDVNLEFEGIKISG